MTDKEELKKAIAVLEAQRAILGDAVVDTAIAPIREQLAAQPDPRHRRRGSPRLRISLAHSPGYFRATSV